MTEIVSLSKSEFLIYEAGCLKGQSDSLIVAGDHLESAAAHYESDFRDKISDKKQLEEAIQGLIIFRSIAEQLKQRSHILQKQAKEKTSEALRARSDQRSLIDRSRRAIIKAIEEFRR